MQIPRVARARGLSEEVVRVLVARLTEGQQFGFLGDARVNVLELNLALDDLRTSASGPIGNRPQDAILPHTELH
jgi:hypothetical protein